MRKLLILLLLPSAVVIAGCDLFGSSSEELELAYSFQTERARFEIGDSIQATFANQSAQTLYLQHIGCLIVGIEQFVGSSWESIPIPILCTQEVKPPVPVDAGERIQVELAAWVLKEADIDPGTYRLFLYVSKVKDRDGRYVKVTSNQFKVVVE